MNEEERRRGCGASIIVVIASYATWISRDYYDENRMLVALMLVAVLSGLVIFAAKNDLGA